MMTTMNSLHTRLSAHVHSERELQLGGFPRPPAAGEPSDAASLLVTRHSINVVSDGSLLRKCERCKQNFRIERDGSCTQPCRHHWGKQVGAMRPKRWTCCGQSYYTNTLVTPGCERHPRHVSEDERECDAGGYVQTEASDPGDPRRSAVYALDCEKVFTAWGLVLGRVTVVDGSSKVVLNEIIRPAYPIIDYNTRFSGLTAEDFRGVQTSLGDFQESLLPLVSAETILVGHSLENDLRALRLIHSRVVDVSLLFPHPLGPPRKLGLRQLVEEKLGRRIQDSAAGHDSAEDAVAALHLAKYKIGAM